jgi:hypothetical protein
MEKKKTNPYVIYIIIIILGLIIGWLLFGRSGDNHHRNINNGHSQEHTM